VDSAKIMAKGQITLPKDLRDALRIGTGDRVTLVYDGEKIIMMNSMHYAMKILQAEMRGAGEEAGLKTDDDVASLVTDMRRELESGDNK
jgi:AbrB family looped-hinge helix DNA binding protein